MIKTKYLTINTDKRIEFVNITSQIQDFVKESNIKEGIILINPMHITASVFVNDEESGLKQDFKDWLEKLAPKNKDYNHHQTGEDNGFSHLWRTIIGRETTIAITNSQLDLGTWEQVFYGEFDGQRDKRILMKIVGE